MTDIQGSTRHWEATPHGMRQALELHDRLVSETIASQGGRVLTTHGEGDSFFAVFPLATEAVAAACLIQQKLAAQGWPQDVRLQVRMALHSGEAGGDYRGRAANRCGRLRACGHGGQVLLSATAAELVQELLPSDVRLLNLGKHQLRDLDRQERIFQLIIPGLPATFPPLKSLRAGEHARLEVEEQVRRHWLQTGPAQSLNKLARIELGLTEHPSAVDNSLRAILRRPDEPDRAIEPGMPIVAVYRQLGKQLLILGAPGAGKTTMLLELADQLLAELEDPSTERMPVIFHLSSWAVERRDLAAWLVDELHKRYGVGRRLGQTWIDGEQIIPLLDGLDEVAAEHRGACVAAINAFHDDHGQLPLVVCSRLDDYELLPKRLSLRGAIVIQALTRSEVAQYLRESGPALAGVRTALDEDEQLAELLTTPLFLSIAALTYQGQPSASVRGTGTLEERRQRLLADYVVAMVDRPRASAAPTTYSSAQTLSWLAWLARVMKVQNQSVFYIDWMQPHWLPKPFLQRLVTVGVSAAIGLVIGIGFGLLFGLSVGVVIGIVVAMIIHESSIAPTERLHWSWARLRRSLPGWLTIGLGVGLGFALVFWLVLPGLVVGLTDGLPDLGPLRAGLLIGLGFGLGFGLCAGLSSGLETQVDITPATPGGGIRTSRRNALVSALVFGIGFWLIIGLVVALIVLHGAQRQHDLRDELYFAVLAGLTPGLLIGLAVGLLTQERSASRLEERTSFSPTRRQTLASELIIGLPAGVMFGLVTELHAILTPLPNEIVRLAILLTAILLVGLALTLVVRVVSRLGALNSQVSVATKAWTDNAFVSGLGAALILALSSAVPITLAVTMAVGLTAGLRRGGGAYLRHHVLRRLLVRAGVAPHHYSVFLEYATGLVLLRRRGGGFEFVHQLILEYFATSVHVDSRYAAASTDVPLAVVHS